jgi:hypothetical protein
MIEAYKIAANLTITGDAQKKMSSIATAAKKLSDQMKIINSKLPAMNRHFEQFQRIIAATNPLLATTVVQFKTLSATMPRMNEGFATFNSRTGNTERRLDRMSMKAENARVRLNMLGNAALVSGEKMSAIGVGRGFGGGGVRGGGKGMMGNFTGGLAGGLGLYNPSMMAGAGVAAGAIAIEKRGWHQGLEYSRSLGQLSAMGYSPSQLDFVRKFTSQAKPGQSQSDQLEAFVDAQMATQSFTMAKVLSPIIAQNKYASAMYGGMTKKQVQDSIRTAEMIGGSNPAKVAQALTTVLQMTALSGGSIMPSEQRAFMRQAAGAASRLTPEGYLSLEPVMQEYGGSKTGTALTTGLRAFSNPKISNFARYQVNNLKKFGLWDDKANRMNQKYLELIQTDPSQFAQIWLGQLARKGVTSDSGIITETMSSFPRTFGTLMSLLIKNMDKITRERSLIAGLPKGEGISGIFSHTQLGAQLRLSKSFDSFAKSVNDLTSPTIIDGMNKLASIFETMARFISSNQALIKNTISGTGSSLLQAIPGGGLLSAGYNYLHEKPDVVSGSTKQSNASNTGDVFLDSQKVGSVLWNTASKSLHGILIAQQGQSGVNQLSTAFPSPYSGGNQ